MLAEGGNLPATMARGERTNLRDAAEHSIVFVPTVADRAPTLDPTVAVPFNAADARGALGVIRVPRIPVISEDEGDLTTERDGDVGLVLEEVLALLPTKVCPHILCSFNHYPTLDKTLARIVEAKGAVDTATDGNRGRQQVKLALDYPLKCAHEQVEIIRITALLAELSLDLRELPIDLEILVAGDDFFRHDDLLVNGSYPPAPYVPTNTCR